MKITNETVSPSKHRLTVEVPASDVSVVYREVLQAYRNKVNVPGFRPGKAPIEMVRQRLGGTFPVEVAEKIVERFGGEAIRQEDLRAVPGGVYMDGVDAQEEITPARENEPYTFVLAVDVMPRIEVANYTDLKVSRPTVEVAVEDVQAEMERIRRSQGQLVDVVDRPSQTGDIVLAQLGGVELGGDVKVDSAPHVVKLGEKGVPPEVERALSGRRVDDDLAFEVAYPADHGEERLRGRVVTYSGKVAGIKREEIPELSDEIARKLGEGEFSGLAELREKVTAAVQARKEHEADQVVRRRLLDTLLDAHPFEPPKTMIEAEVRERLELIGRRLASEGIDPDRIDVDWDKVIARERELADRAVREGLLLDAIARKEAMTVEPSALEHEIAHLAEQVEQPVHKVRAKLVQSGGLRDMERQLLRRQCLDWLFTKAHIV